MKLICANDRVFKTDHIHLYLTSTQLREIASELEKLEKTIDIGDNTCAVRVEGNSTVINFCVHLG